MEKLCSVKYFRGIIGLQEKIKILQYLRIIFLLLLLPNLYQREYKIQYFQELSCYYTPKELYNAISWYNSLCLLF